MVLSKRKHAASAKAAQQRQYRARQSSEGLSSLSRGEICRDKIVIADRLEHAKRRQIKYQQQLVNTLDSTSCDPLPAVDGM